jgi:hypothetical protein
MLSRLSLAAAAVLMTSTLTPKAGSGQQVQAAGVQYPAVGSRVRVFAPTLRRDRFVGRIDSLTTERWSSTRLAFAGDSVSKQGPCSWSSIGA